MDEKLELVKKALIGKYFVKTKDGEANYGDISDVRLFKEEYIIEIKWNTDNTRRNFYYSEEEIEALTTLGVYWGKDGRTTYILQKEANFTSCIIKQVASEKNAHTTDDVWQERWWQMFLKFSPSVFEGKDYWSHVIDITNLGIKEAREEMERFFKEEEK